MIPTPGKVKKNKIKKNNKLGSILVFFFTDVARIVFRLTNRSVNQHIEEIQ